MPEGRLGAKRTGPQTGPFLRDSRHPQGRASTPARRGMMDDAGSVYRRAAPTLGSPERGAVAARRAVTEGLRPASVRCGCLVGEGFHALPALDEGLPRTPVQNGARAAPAGLNALGCGRETDAPEVTRVQSVKPNVCV